MDLRTFNRDKRRHLQDVIGTYNHTFLECFYLFFFMVRDTTQELKKIEETRIYIRNYKWENDNKNYGTEEHPSYLRNSIVLKKNVICTSCV